MNDAIKGKKHIVNSTVNKLLDGKQAKTRRKNIYLWGTFPRQRVSNTKESSHTGLDQSLYPTGFAAKQQHYESG
ncbi:MAG: hypothetical protein ABFD08_02035 [Syntrophomonas sp.]